MLTGDYLPSHGIRGFTDSLADDQWTILDAFKHAGLSDSAGNFNNEIYGNLLGKYSSVSLAEIQEPFGWFMRDAGGHAPYDEFDETLQTQESVSSYLKRHAGDDERMRRDYEAGVQSSVERFERFVLNPLEERGIREETLIVFLSDHGQMLGEHGHVGESYPPCPEIVYVPTTFIHPSLKPREAGAAFGHVDLPATIAGLVDDLETPETHGRDVHSRTAGPSKRFSFYDRPYPSPLGEFSYTIESVWDDGGGHAFLDSSFWDKLKLLGGVLALIPAGKQLRRSRSLRGLKLLFESPQTWGSPGFTLDEAAELLEEFELADGQSLDMDTETRENLEDLGYL
ncbi:sulfatase-like hydrolase/transferase [Haloarcula sp. GH36]|uniref:sulfatase-like hydrolase/transferase n=1 Tax=Haloarcula montana TaxID=3111776 RepID=UPI002D765370|nr:sulfatase-like hydrolase/transferase [Haloarcula sp. GH36]